MNLAGTYQKLLAKDEFSLFQLLLSLVSSALPFLKGSLKEALFIYFCVIISAARGENGVSVNSIDSAIDKRFCCSYFVSVRFFCSDKTFKPMLLPSLTVISVAIVSS